MKKEWVSSFFALCETDQEKKIVARLKKRVVVMESVYTEIEEQMKRLPNPRDLLPERRADPILWAIINGAVHYDPKVKQTQRQIRKELLGFESKIIETAMNLITLLNAHERMETDGRFEVGAYLDIFFLIEEAAKNNPRIRNYERYIAPAIHPLRHRFSTSYYPTFQEILRAVIHQVQENKPIPWMPEDAAALAKRKDRTVTDFIRFFDSTLKDEKRMGTLPKEFSLRQSSIATITECALDLDKNHKISDSTVSKAIGTFKPKKSR
jgi:hypothetical protein